MPEIAKDANFQCIHNISRKQACRRDSLSLLASASSEHLIPQHGGSYKILERLYYVIFLSRIGCRRPSLWSSNGARFDSRGIDRQSSMST